MYEDDVRLWKLGTEVGIKSGGGRLVGRDSGLGTPRPSDSGGVGRACVWEGDPKETRRQGSRDNGGGVV